MAEGLDQNIVDLLNHAPELQQTPGLSLGLAQGISTLQGTNGVPLDPAQVGQSASLALTHQGVQQAQQDINSVTSQPKKKAHHDGGIFSDIGSFFGHVGHDINNDVIKPAERDVIAPAGHVLNAGLNEVTHTYRYIHDVWQRHGVMAALGELGVIAAGAAAGVALAPETAGASLAAFGGILGGELAGDIGARTIGHQDSWQATNNGGAYLDAQGWHVSPGRDFVRLIGHLMGQPVQHNAQGNITGNGGLNFLSGLTDATFDLSLDPAIKLGQIYRGLKVGGYVTRGGTRGIGIGDNRILVGRTPRALIDPDGIRANDVQAIYRQNPAVNDAFNRIAGMDTAKILSNYPALAPMAAALGRASSGQEVANVFEQAFTARNYSFIKHGLPATSLTRRLLGQMGVNTPTLSGMGTAVQSTFSRVARDDNGNPLISKVTGMPIRVPWGPGHIINGFTTYAPFAFNSKTLEISGHEGDPMDPEFMRGLYSVLRYSQNAATSRQVLAKFAEAPDLNERINIVTNAYKDALRASGLPDTDPLITRYTGDIDFLNKSAMSSVYGVDRDGRVLKLADDEGNAINRGITINQTGKIAFPDFNEWNRALRDQRGAIWHGIGATDDFLNRYITTRFFKRLVLLSLGFALRVSSGELIPAIVSNDARRVIGGGLAAASAKLNPSFDELLRDFPREEGDHPLIGVRVVTKGRPQVGTIKDFDAEAGEAHVAFPGEEPQAVPFKQLTAFHGDVTDEEIRKIAKDYGLTVTTGELPHIKAAAGKALYGVSRALVDRDYRDVALLNILANDGHLVAPGLASFHDMPRGFNGIHNDVREASLRAGINLPKRTALGKSFRLWDSGDQHHPLFWRFAIGEQAQDPGFRAMARSYHEAIRGGADEASATQAAIKADRTWWESEDPRAVQAQKEMAGYWRDPESYSAVRAEALKGMTYGQNGKLQEDVIQAIARGDAPSIADLAEKDILDRPVAVKGRTLDPIPELGAFSRGINQAWRPIHGVINSLSRAPIYTMLVTDEYKAFKPWIDAGVMTKTEAHSIAQVRSLNRMLPLIHNTLLRNKFALATRNLYPFYFAQEQAYKRYGRAMWDNPKAFREVQLLMHGLFSSGSLQKDAQGNEHIVIPGIGQLPFLATLALGNLGINTLSGVPSSVSGDTISLRSVVPEFVGPGVAPMVAVPLKELASQFPQSDPFVKSILGPVSYGSTMTQEIIPNATLRRAWEALDPSDKNRAFGGTFMANAAWAAHKALPLWEHAEKFDPRAMDPSVPRSQLKPEAAALLAKADSYLPLPNAELDPNVQRRAMDRIKNSTRIQLLMKAALGFVSPLAPSLAVGDVGLKDEFQSDLAKYGLTKGMQVFMDRHPDATPDTVFQSDNTATGVSPPATKAALDWIDQNRGWIGNNLLAASYLVPQAPGKYDSVAYNEELAMHLRQRRTPQQFVDAIYTAEGNAEFIPSLKAYQDQRKQLQGNYQALKQLGDQWQSYIGDLAHRNPVWYDNMFSNNKATVAVAAYDQLRKAVNNTSTPQSPMLDDARQLISDYQSYQQERSLVDAGHGTVSKSALKAQWYDYLDSYVAQHPEAQAMAYGVFRRLVADF